VDAETRAYLDTALGGLRREIRAVGAETAELRQELVGQAAELRRDLAGAAELRQELLAETAELRRDIQAGAAETAELRREIRREMRETAAETRRHFDVGAESIRSDVRAVAEGVAASSETLERLGRDLRTEMGARFTSSHAVVRVALAELRRDIQAR
jgi:uncharacterized protein YaaN involved in tellurite resistance